jgi:hypothetical protein
MTPLAWQHPPQPRPDVPGQGSVCRLPWLWLGGALTACARPSAAAGFLCSWPWRGSRTPWCASATCSSRATACGKTEKRPPNGSDRHGGWRAAGAAPAGCAALLGVPGASLQLPCRRRASPRPACRTPRCCLLLAACNPGGHVPAVSHRRAIQNFKEPAAMVEALDLEESTIPALNTLEPRGGAAAPGPGPGPGLAEASSSTRSSSSSGSSRRRGAAGSGSNEVAAVSSSGRAGAGSNEPASTAEAGAQAACTAASAAELQGTAPGASQSHAGGGCAWQPQASSAMHQALQLSAVRLCEAGGGAGPGEGQGRRQQQLCSPHV